MKIKGYGKRDAKDILTEQECVSYWKLTNKSASIIFIEDPKWQVNAGESHIGSMCQGMLLGIQITSKIMDIGVVAVRSGKIVAIWGNNFACKFSEALNYQFHITLEQEYNA